MLGLHVWRESKGTRPTAARVPYGRRRGRAVSHAAQSHGYLRHSMHPIDGAEAAPSRSPATLLPLRRFAAYTGAGLVSGAANVLLLHIAIYAHMAPHLAWVIAFEVGTLLAFILHRQVTWRDYRVTSLTGVGRQLWEWQVSSLTAALVNVAIFTVLIGDGVAGESADIAGLAAGFILNYAFANIIYGPFRLNEGRHRSRRS